MPYQFNLRGIPVTCDSLEELLEAVSAGLADARSPGDVHASIDSTGSPANPHSPAVVVVQTAPTAPTAMDTSKSKKRDDKPQGSGPKRAWAEAEEYAKKHGITPGEARSKLAKIKRDAAAAAVKKAEASFKK